MICCNKCNFETNSNSKFCPNCGSEISLPDQSDEKDPLVELRPITESKNFSVGGFIVKVESTMKPMRIMKVHQRVESDVKIQSSGGGGSISGAGGVVSGSISQVKISSNTSHNVINQIFLLDPTTKKESIREFNNDVFSPREGHIVYSRSVSFEYKEKTRSIQIGLFSNETGQKVLNVGDAGLLELLENLLKNEPKSDMGTAEAFIHIGSIPLFVACFWWLNGLLFNRGAGWFWVIEILVVLYLSFGPLGTMFCGMLIPGYRDNNKKMNKLRKLDEQQSKDRNLVLGQLMAWAKSA